MEGPQEKLEKAYEEYRKRQSRRPRTRLRGENMETWRKVALALAIGLMVVTMTAGSCAKGGDCLSDNPSDCNPVMVATIQAAPTQCLRDWKGVCVKE